MRRIGQLDAQVVNKIAAGEVIERPASVVKELLENSVDALATRIDVEIGDGGAELIRIVDNGEGIHPDDLQLAVTSHATSKIRSSDDLFSVKTMGFRGEALASIASVSRFRIRSRVAGAETGVELESDGGDCQPPVPCGCPQGTLVEIRQLFCNTPVRRKFLKTKATEFGHISEQFTRIALANPRLQMTLRHNDKNVYQLPAATRMLDRLRLFAGSELTEKLIWVESEAPVSADSSERIRIWGYVGHPSHSKSTRKGQYLFLNGRWFQDRTLQHALSEAYRGLLMVGRHPVAYLFFEMPSDLVDVNVHPCKWEVRFRDSQQLYRQLLSMIRNEFLSQDLDSRLELQSGPSSGSSGSSGSVQASSAAPGDYRSAAADAAAVRQLKFEEPRPDWSIPKPASPQTTAAYSEHDGRRPSGLEPATQLPPGSEAAYSESVGRRPATETSLGSETADSESTNPSPSGLEPDLAIPPGPEATYSVQHRAIQVHDCYLVLPAEEGLLVIDQHALHERILYEYLRERVLEGDLEIQKLLVPLTLEISSAESAMLQDYQELFADLGFQIEPFGSGTVALHSYPALLRKANLAQIVRDLCEHLGQPGQQPTRRDVLDEVLHMMSCKAAIKAGQRLSAEEMDQLLEQRHLVHDTHHCPHGRPTALVLSRQMLDRQFGRLG